MLILGSARSLLLSLVLVCVISSSLRSSSEDAQKGLNPVIIYTSPLQAVKKGVRDQGAFKKRNYEIFQK